MMYRWGAALMVALGLVGSAAAQSYQAYGTHLLPRDEGGSTATLNLVGEEESDDDTQLVHRFRYYSRGFGYRPFYGYSYRSFYPRSSFYYPRSSFSFGFNYYNPRYYYRSFYPSFNYGGYYGGYYGSYYYAPPVYYYPCSVVLTPGSSSILPGQETPRPMPRAEPQDGTFPYNGGPSNPVPMPRADEPAPSGAPRRTVPLDGISVSLPSRTSQFAYPAYGERTPVATPEEYPVLLRNDPTRVPPR